MLRFSEPTNLELASDSRFRTTEGALAFEPDSPLLFKSKIVLPTVAQNIEGFLRRDVCIVFLYMSNLLRIFFYARQNRLELELREGVNTVNQ